MVQCVTLELHSFLLGEGSGDHGRLAGHVSVIWQEAVTGHLPEGKRKTLGCFYLLGFISPLAFCLLFTLCQHPISFCPFSISIRFGKVFLYLRNLLASACLLLI